MRRRFQLVGVDLKRASVATLLMLQLETSQRDSLSSELLFVGFLAVQGERFELSYFAPKHGFVPCCCFGLKTSQRYYLQAFI